MECSLGKFVDDIELEATVNLQGDSAAIQGTWAEETKLDFSM